MCLPAGIGHIFALDHFELTTTTLNSRVRAVPSPAFNAADQSHVQPLANQPKNDMDESYVQPAIAASGAQFQDQCTWAHSEILTSADLLAKLEAKFSTR